MTTRERRKIIKKAAKSLIEYKPGDSGYGITGICYALYDGQNPIEITQQFSTMFEGCRDSRDPYWWPENDTREGRYYLNERLFALAMFHEIPLGDVT